MTIIGLILAIAGGLGTIMTITGAGGELHKYVGKMPGGLVGWIVVAIVGGVLMMLNRQVAD